MSPSLPRSDYGIRRTISGRKVGVSHRRRKDPTLLWPFTHWDGAAEMDLLRDLFRRDFWSFFLHGFGAGANPKGKRWIDPAVHRPLADWFQNHVLEWHEKRTEGIGEQKHLAIVIHREVGKTTMITQAGQLWLHLLDPEMSSYTGSERLELSMKILGGIKGVLDGSDPYALFTKLYGNWSTDARTWSAKDIIHAARKNTSRRDPSFGTFAVETSIVGAHPDAWFEDDPNSYERISTDSNWLATVNSQVTSMVPVIQSDGLIVWVGTRYDDDDHFGMAFAGEGIASISGMETDSLSVSPEGMWHVYFLSGRDTRDRAEPHPDGRPTTPKVWPEQRMRRYQKRDPLRYAAQVLNDPSVSEFNPLTKEQIRQCVVKSTEVPWSALRFAICTDTAFWDGKKQQGKDETVLIVHGYPRNGSGDVYVVEGHGSNTWRAEDFAKVLVATVQRYRKQGRKVFALTDEVTMAGKKDAWRLALQNYFSDVNEPMPMFYQFDRGGAKKVHRISAASSFWVDGHVRIIEGSPGSERLMDQMSRIGQYLVNPRLKDDWADAHADAFQPELYQPMRRVGPQKAPYERGARSLYVEGLDPEDFSDPNEWGNECPRPPLR